jgi:hypothetical protein
VVVQWDDACDRSVSIEWDGTFEKAHKAEAVAPLYRNRQTTGWLIYVNDDALWLAHDYDQDEQEVHNFTVIPLGWVNAVRAGRRVLFIRGES